VPENTPPEGSNDIAPTGEVKLQTLGRYRILDELGRGGCGVVYRAMDPSIGRTVAIKTILAKSEPAAGQESRERFRREARSAGNLSHPNIVTVHDFSDSGDPMFIAMEFVEGRTLAEHMSSGPLPTDFILGVLRSAADALDYAHAQHIVHRDVKPANFLITKSGRLKITDFGIAKMLDSDEGLTNPGIVVGTVQYMSPEQISEPRVTGRSDQFSLAVIAYEMLTGVKPFQGNSWASVIHAIIMAEPPPVNKFRDNLSEEANSALRKALSKDPVARYSTCTEFCEALEHAILGPTIERTAIYSKTHSAVPAPEKALAITTQPFPRTPDTIRQVASPARARAVKPLVIGALGGAVVAAALWLGLRSRTTPRPVAPVVAQHVAQQVAQQHDSTPPQPAQPTPSAPPVIETPSAGSGRQAVKQNKQVVSAPPLQPGELPQPIQNVNPAPVPTIETAPPSPQPPVVTAPVATPTPAPPRPRVQEDQAKSSADDQAKRLADEQAKRAADDQTRRLGEERAAAARIAADDAAISRALKEYQGAYERKDLAALQTIWPSIPKASLDGIRGSFHDASQVSMELRPVGEPKVSGNSATILCDRSLRQVILKRVFQASGRVRIVLLRAGTGWTIQSVDPVNQ
jgi:serine/threonine protein kinase